MNRQDISTLYIPRSEVRKLLGMPDSTLSGYIKRHKIRPHRFGYCREGMFHRDVVQEIIDLRHATERKVSESMPCFL